MRYLASWIGAAWFFGATVAMAQPSDVEPSEAERLFKEGRAALLAERYEEACPKLEKRQELEPRVGTLLHRAACHEKLGMTATAWHEFGAAHDAAAKEGRDEQRAFAAERVAALEPRVPWLTVVLAAHQPGVAIALDGEPLDPDE